MTFAMNYARSPHTLPRRVSASLLTGPRCKRATTYGRVGPHRELLAGRRAPQDDGTVGAGGGDAVRLQHLQDHVDLGAQVVGNLLEVVGFGDKNCKETAKDCLGK